MEICEALLSQKFQSKGTNLENALDFQFFEAELVV